MNKRQLPPSVNLDISIRFLGVPNLAQRDPCRKDRFLRPPASLPFAILSRADVLRALGIVQAQYDRSNRRLERAKCACTAPAHQPSRSVLTAEAGSNEKWAWVTGCAEDPSGLGLEAVDACAQQSTPVISPPGLTVTLGKPGAFQHSTLPRAITLRQSKGVS